MTKIIRDIAIAAAPEKIMEYISNVKNHTAFIPPLKSVDDVEGDEQTVGAGWTWTFEMGGMEFSGKAETVEYVPGQKFQYKTTGGIESIFTYSVTSDGEGSRLTVEVVYEVPASVLGQIADKSVVENMNTAQADAATQNIKAILEG